MTYTAQYYHDTLVSTLAAIHQRAPREALTGFVGMKGAFAPTRLAIVGRAVNGWSEGWLPENMTTGPVRRRCCDEILQCALDTTKCPLSVISDNWNTGRYRFNKSAFWRVVRHVVQSLGIANVTDPAWPSHIAWTNLYKFAPEAGGNPSERLCQMQFDGCVQLLQYELELWNPERVLFLTGLAWAKPFLDKMKIASCEAVSNSLVEATAHSTCPIVVAQHPQGKSENRMVDDIVRRFKMVERNDINASERHHCEGD